VLLNITAMVDPGWSEGRGKPRSD